MKTNDSSYFRIRRNPSLQVGALFTTDSPSRRNGSDGGKKGERTNPTDVEHGLLIDINGTPFAVEIRPFFRANDEASSSHRREGRIKEGSGNGGVDGGAAAKQTRKQRGGHGKGRGRVIGARASAAME